MGQNAPFYWQQFTLQVAGVVVTVFLGAISGSPEKTGLDPFWVFWGAVILGAASLAIQKALSLLPSAEQKVEISNLKEDKKRLIAQLPEEQAARPSRAVKAKGGGGEDPP